MKDFDKEFIDIIDYIKRITYRIWEGKQIGLCYDYYSNDCPIYTLDGIFYGSDTVVQNTLDTLASFPDRTLHADQIIWGGNDTDGYHSSHRICTHMTNLGPSSYGEATGKKAIITVIAHCIVKGNKIIKEWLVRDNYSLCEQLGYQPKIIAKEKARLPLQKDFIEWKEFMLNQISIKHSKIRQPYPVFSTQSDSEAFICASLHNIWNTRMLGDIMQNYAADARLYTTRKRELNGHNEITFFYLQILSTFSQLKFSIDYVCSNTEGYDNAVAVRWSLSGIHSGNQLYGSPTQEAIFIIGESHFLLKNNKIYQEWTMFDELSVMTQIERSRIKQERLSDEKPTA
ncbi:ester cyclase [Cysteiniphilum halobium]|uniref:nuclear transport factor 2 family protein n=1 Tax=Cysteiniphilum halobium TaxID=2219059 RepID=UPI003F838F56